MPLRVPLRCYVVPATLMVSIAIGKYSNAAEFLVSSAAEISATLPMVQPGDALVMTNGDWTNQTLNFSAAGTSASPITLRAETPGQVILNGSSSLNISGDWLVVDGLRFDGGALSSGHVVEFRGGMGEATNSRLTNSAIVNYNPSNINTRYFWVSLYGQNNRVDHNYFEGQNHSGVTVVAWRNSNNPDFHQIDNNHFAARPEGNGNGFETIRIGTSDESLSDSFTTVENNLFEEQDGEIEIISNKSGNNTFRYNTFRNSAGTLTLRHGDDNLVEGNFFLGQNRSGSGGVRVIGERQTIINNYFANLDGRADGAISISAGVENSAVNEYYQVKDATIAHNTIVNVEEAAIALHHGLGSSNRTLLPEDVTLANNLIRSTADPLFDGNPGSGWNWEGNIAFGQSLGAITGNPGVQVIDPQLVVGSDGLWRPDTGSPAIDGGVSGYASLVMDDMDGQPRISMPDVGSDESSAASIVRRPLIAGDVGPSWLDDGPIVTPHGCSPNGLAIQAEDARILDSNGNGNQWVVTSAGDALGGENLRAPVGSTVNRPGDAHDTLAVYDIVFDKAGTYTAYFRARGFDTSSDSIYTPTDFGIDPESIEVLSSNGQYNWETGITFEISESDVGLPLEFRVGRREFLTDLDAIVFHLEDDLQAADLEALFSLPCHVDFNDDSIVDLTDIDALVAEIVANTDGSLFDLNGDNQVNIIDLFQWLDEAGAINLDSGNDYLLADANLDGSVDLADLHAWNNHKFTAAAAWSKGDFNADGSIDELDFNSWLGNRFQNSANSQLVPEPGVHWHLAWILLVLRLRHRRR